MPVNINCFFFLFREKETKRIVYIFGTIYHVIAEISCFRRAIIYEYIRLGETNGLIFDSCGYYSKDRVVHIFPFYLREEIEDFCSKEIIEINIYYTNINNLSGIPSPILCNESLYNLLRESVSESEIEGCSLAIVYQNSVLFTQITKEDDIEMIVYSEEPIFDIFIYGGIKQVTFLEKLWWCISPSKRITEIPYYIKSAKTKIKSIKS